LLGDCAFDAIL